MNKKMRKYLFLPLAVLGIIALSSCEKVIDESESDELLRLQAYMSIHYPNAEPTASGLYLIIEQEGTGATPSNNDFLLFDYTGRNLDDYVFETTIKSTAKLHDLYSARIHYAPTYQQYNSSVATMIKGLQEGLTQLKEGGIARLIMPSKLAYGSRNYQGLHPYSSLIFDVELIKVISDPKEYEQQLIEEYISENYPELVIEDALVDSIYILENLTDNDYAAERRDSISEGETVNLYYSGSFVDGFVFDTNIIEVAKENDIYDIQLETQKKYEPISVKVGSSDFIPGFSLALKNLQTSTNVRILIPSEFAYGVSGSPTIHPYTPLIFDLRVLKKVTTEE
jgi:FKBP-type peptidyl-prolyl cis-trans isomerase